MIVTEAIANVFARRNATAMFATELFHALEGACTLPDFDEALGRLVTTGEIMIVPKPAPDVHLNDVDLRIVARTEPDAAAAVEAAWQRFLREFLASHRCS